MGYGDKKEGYGDKKEGYGQEKEPSAELKAAMKACQENELCKKLMECKKKHKESGGKGDGKGGCADYSKTECEAQDQLPCSWDDGKCAMKKKPTEEVCVEEMKACAANEKCSMIHEKLQAAMKKEGGYGGKGGDGKYDDKKEGGYGGDKKEGGKEDGEKKEYPPKKEGGEGGYGGDKKEGGKKKEYPPKKEGGE